MSETKQEKLDRLVKEREKLAKLAKPYEVKVARSIGIDGVINSVVTTVDALFGAGDKK